MTNIIDDLTTVFTEQGTPPSGVREVPKSENFVSCLHAQPVPVDATLTTSVPFDQILIELKPFMISNGRQVKAGQCPTCATVYFAML